MSTDFWIDQVGFLAVTGGLGWLSGLAIMFWNARRTYRTSASGLRQSVWGLAASSAASLRQHAGKLLPLLVWSSLISAVLATVPRSGLSSSTGVVDLLVSVAVIFLAHRIYLVEAARSAGLSPTSGRFAGVLLRYFLFGFLTLAVLAIPAIVIAYLVRSIESGRMQAGIGAGGFIVGAVMLGTLSTVYLARMSLVFPSASLGGNDWFGRALRYSREVGWSLAAALWLAFLGFTAVLVAVAIGADAIFRSIAPADALMRFDQGVGLNVFSAGYWLELVVVELPVAITFGVYMIFCIGIVSTAYRACVIDPVADAASRVPAGELPLPVLEDEG